MIFSVRFGAIEDADCERPYTAVMGVRESVFIQSTMD